MVANPQSLWVVECGINLQKIFLRLKCPDVHRSPGCKPQPCEGLGQLTKKKSAKTCHTSVCWGVNLQNILFARNWTKFQI